MSRPLVKFALVGAFATAIQYGILVLLVEGWQIASPVASTFGFGLSAAANYWLNHRLTFASDVAHRKAMLRFAAMVASGLLMTWLLMFGFDRAGLHYLPSQLATTALVFAWNYWSSSRWVFARASR